MSGLLSALQTGLSVPTRLLDRLYRAFCGTWYIVTMFGIHHSKMRPFSYLAEIVSALWPSVGRAMGDWLTWMDDYRTYFMWVLMFIIVVLVFHLTGRALPVEERYLNDSGRTGSTILLFVLFLQQSCSADASIWSWWWIGLIPVVLFFISGLAKRIDNQRTAEALLTAVAWPFSEVWNVLVGDANSRTSLRGSKFAPVYVQMLEDRA